MIIYKVSVQENIGTAQEALLEPATERDMPDRDSVTWTFDWKELWKKTDFDCEAIVKLSYQGNTLGIVRFGLYPFPASDSPEYLEILHLQCVSGDKRNVNPVGSWLIWYAVQTAFMYCTGEDDGTLIRLDSVEESISYYSDKVRMEGIGWTRIAPGEDGYAFRFTKEDAQSFCRRQESRYGVPIQIF